MLSLSLLAAQAASAACGPEQELPALETLVLRGHTYTRIGTCGSLPVYRTPSTDSTFLDRAAARESTAIILVTDESVDPTTAEDAWPAPAGNLYLSYPYPAGSEAARAAISESVAAWREQHAPEVAMTEGWDERYGAHRAEDGRFLTGLALSPRSDAVDIGLDLHLAATSEQYAALSAEDEHVSIATLTGTAPDREVALWFILSALSAHASEAITSNMHSAAAEHLLGELERHGVRDADGGVVGAERIGGPLTITVRGLVWRHHDGLAVQVGGVSLWLHGGCAVEGMAEVSGILDYATPRGSPGDAPQPAISARASAPDRFSISVTECIQRTEVINGD